MVLLALALLCSSALLTGVILLKRLETRSPAHVAPVAASLDVRISAPGDYVFSDGRRLRVWLDQSLVNYRLLSPQGTVLAKRTVRFSNAQRWGLLLDKEDRLWCASSDIGNSVWVSDDQGKTYREIRQSTKSDPEFSAMPSQLK